MNAKLKLASDDIQLESLGFSLTSDNTYSKISALSLVDSKSIDQVLEQVKICAYDYRPIVRTHAYKALLHANPAKITSVIKDAVRDEDKLAFKAARELLHKASHAYS